MRMSLAEYQNRVKGCWMGKNIGGTLGAPFECARGVVELDFYSQDMSGGAWPNDDLDLQLAWLNAAERYGRSVNAQVLGEYWIDYIVANWSEYGGGKNNLRQGLIPPLSGSCNNVNRNSCGAFIRSELWACLAPGHPEIAVRYAFEDAIVDHADEGVYGEIFCAAVQSAAFVETDTNTLLDIGLSYIPVDCGIAKGIAVVRESRQNGLDWQAARKAVLNAVPGIFGMYRGYCYGEKEDDVPVGESGYDAPSNVAITVLGWLYGEGDFGRSLCIATGCCEDADCTAATLGALLGIQLGFDALPAKWLDPIGEGIKNVALNTVEGLDIPATISDLTDRVVRLMPTFLERSFDLIAEEGAVLHLREGKDLYDALRLQKGRFYAPTFKDYILHHDKSIYSENRILKTKLICRDGLNVQNDVPLRFTFEVLNPLWRQQWLAFHWDLPEGWEVSTGRDFSLNLDNFDGVRQMNFSFTVTPHDLQQAVYDLNLRVSSAGRPSALFIPIKLFNSPNAQPSAVDILKRGDGVSSRQTDIAAGYANYVE